MAQSTWAEIPEPRVVAAGGRAKKLIARVGVPLVLAAVLWAGDVPVVAIVVAVAALLLLLASLAAPVLAARFEHWTGRFAHAVGRVLTVVLLGFVNLLLFTPIAFVMWVFRYDALAPGVRRDEPSFWHAHRGRSLPKRQFADERALWSPVGEASARRRPIMRVATAIGVVTLLLAADLGGGWLYDEVGDASHGTAAVADDTFDPTAQPALRDSSWAQQAINEQTGLPSTRDAYLGYILQDINGVYTHVTNGIRRSYEPVVSGPRLKVWFFGASVLFGDGNRDEHTIPSEVARLAEADGIPIEVRNYGRPGIAMWQELELFEQVLATGDKPDAVVFYDGFNDLLWQLNIRLSSTPINIFDLPSEAAAAASADGLGNGRTKVKPVPTAVNDGTSVSDVLGAYWDQSGTHHVYDAISDLLGTSSTPKARFVKGVEEHDTTGPASDELKTAAKYAVGIQSRAAAVASAIAKGSGFDAMFFWQPTVFTKKLLPAEVAYRSLAGYDPARWVPAVNEVRKLLKKTPIVDLGNALDRATTPVLWDFVHTNEDGAHLAATAIYAHIEPQLRKRIADGALTR